MRLLTATFVFTFITSISWAQPDHATWNSLLQQHVSSSGTVDYKGFKGDLEELRQYLNTLQKTTPSKSWSSDEKLAYWMNAYNAWTVYLITKRLPVSSPKDVKINGKSLWKAEVCDVAGNTYSLDHIEHQIIRKRFNDARIHFGINCAAQSCPKLHNYAFRGATLDRVLNKLTKEFINGPKNKISQNSVKISQIFNWFKSDFVKAEGSVIKFLNKYSTTSISPSAKVSYATYNWDLND